MRQRPLGRTGLAVGEIGLGAWAIGGALGLRAYGPTDDGTSLAAIARAVELGVTFFDTADVYGKGHSEELLGKALAGVRARVVIATKAGWDFAGPGEPVYNHTAEHLRGACDASLRRLGLSHIDIYQLHNPTADVLQRGDAVGAMRELARAGKVRFVGVSIKTPEEAAAAMEAGVDTIQLPYSYLERAHEGRTFREALARGVGVIAREPLARGFLTGKYTSASSFGEGDIRSQLKPDELRRRLAQVDEFRSLARPDVPLARAALKFVLAQPAVAVAIPGAKTPAQVEANAAASDGAYHLSGDVFDGGGGDE